MRRICVVTGARAEYGLLVHLLKDIEEASSLSLQLLVTGTHLSPEFGLTWQEIERDGFSIDARVEMLLSSDSGMGVAKSIGLGVIGAADALDRLSPDVLVVLGDRFEVFAVAAAALPLGIPVAHLHGGERSEGAIDESFRHAITKLSHLHFVASEEYRRRVIQLGEDPSRVFNVGGLGVDAIRRSRLLGQSEVEERLGFSLAERNLLVTYHPETVEPELAGQHFSELMSALSQLESTTILITQSNADASGRRLWEMAQLFATSKPQVHLRPSLGHELYVSALQYFDAVVGNSSSGLAEAPTLGIATVNIGSRQQGRLQGSSVINAAPYAQSILDAIATVYSPEFEDVLAGAENPYGDGGASARIVNVLQEIPLERLNRKSFFDIENPQ